MKICTVVGISRSGKTTTVTGLVREMKKRGYRVGTVKSCFCPDFSIDKPDSNTWKHREAGADFVCLKGKKEMDMIMKPDLTGSTYESLPADYLILEGEYELVVPRIICARSEAELDERMTSETFAAAGVIADRLSTYKGIRVFHSMNEISLLADLVEKLPDAAFPLDIQGMPGKVSAFCQCGCHKTADQLPLTAHPRDTKRKHIFLTGEKQVGKSTVLSKVLADARIAAYCREKGLAGFRTYPLMAEGVRKGFYMHSLLPVAACDNDLPVVIRIGPNKMVPVSETFEILGSALLADAVKQRERLVLLDELGKAEKKAPAFQRMVFRTLDTQDLVLGVLQKGIDTFAQTTGLREDVKVYTITEDNRDDIPGLIINEVRDILGLYP